MWSLVHQCFYCYPLFSILFFLYPFWLFSFLLLFSIDWSIVQCYASLFFIGHPSFFCRRPTVGAAGSSLKPLFLAVVVVDVVVAVVVIAGRRWRLSRSVLTRTSLRHTIHRSDAVYKLRQRDDKIFFRHPFISPHAAVNIEFSFPLVLSFPLHPLHPFYPFHRFHPPPPVHYSPRLFVQSGYLVDYFFVLVSLALCLFILFLCPVPTAAPTAALTAAAVAVLLLLFQPAPFLFSPLTFLLSFWRILTSMFRRFTSSDSIHR